MDIYRFDNYRAYVSARIKVDAREKKGGLRRIAEHLGVHGSLVTRVLNGSHHFTPDQAFLLAEHFTLNASESDYFIALVQYERAGNPKYRKKLKRQLDEIKGQARLVAEPGGADHPLSERNQSIFYSYWYYSAVRLLTSIPRFSTSDAISKHLGLPEPIVEQVVEFLISTGLCIEKDGALAIGPRNTHISGDSPMIDRHLINWRMKAIERLPSSKAALGEFFHARPMIVSTTTAQEVRELLVSFIKEVGKLEEKGSRDQLVCLNLDLFRI